MLDEKDTCVRTIVFATTGLSDQNLMLYDDLPRDKILLSVPMADLMTCSQVDRCLTHGIL